jgi:splicing factor 3A subunit 3
MTYLENFDHLFDIPAERKNTDYKAYLEALIQYFAEYLGKIRPLLDLDRELDDVSKNFEKEWDAGTFPGWPVRTKVVFAFIAHLCRVYDKGLS